MRWQVRRPSQVIKTAVPQPGQYHLRKQMDRLTS
jgi:hypothetical protein